MVSAHGAFGGPTSVACQQARTLAKHGHEVTLIAGWDRHPAALQTSPFKIRLFKARQFIPRSKFSGLWAPSLVIYLVKERRSFDVVHIHLGRDLVSLSAALVVASMRLPYVVQTHGMIGQDKRMRARLFDKFATRRALRRAKHVLYLTNPEKNALKRVASAELPMVHLRNGIAGDQGAAATRHSVRDPTILFCARLHPRKRVLAFVDMAAELIKRGVTANFVVAGPDEGDLAQLVKRMVGSDLGGHLTYHGALSPESVQRELRKAYVYVLPSINEPFPMTVLEAIAVGTPVVVTQSCHIAEDLEAQGAALVTDGTPGSLAAAVQRLLNNNSLYNELRSQGLRATESTYSIEAVGVRLKEIYEKAI